MPAPATIGRQPQVLLQALVVLQARPMRQIFGNGVSRLLDRRKAFSGMSAHEALHLGDALIIDAWGDIDQHDG